jgi:hypothetical protein
MQTLGQGDQNIHALRNAHVTGAEGRTAHELLLIVVFSSVLDCKNRHDIHG